MTADEEVNKGFRALGQKNIGLSRLPVHSFSVQEQESALKSKLHKEASLGVPVITADSFVFSLSVQLIMTMHSVVCLKILNLNWRLFWLLSDTCNYWLFKYLFNCTFLCPFYNACNRKCRPRSVETSYLG